MKETVARLLNQQINKEFYSAYLYLAFSNYFNDQGLSGFANWFKIQFQEEQDHAMLMMQYLQNNDETVTLEAIEKPEGGWNTHMDVLTRTLAHEKGVTASIDEIYHQASKDHDYRTIQFLDWFVKEQGEEEKNATDLIRKLELLGNDPKGLYLLDQELSARVYSAPSLTL